MKVSRGKVKLDKRDVRVGNFVYTREDDHIRVQDISRTVSHRIEKRIPKGQLLDIWLSSPDEHRNALTAYAVVTFNYLCAVPDPALWDEVNRAVVACVNRHKDIYGIKDDISQEEDAAVLKEERGLHDAVEEIREKTAGQD